MSEETTLEQWKSLAADTLVLSDPQTRRPIREIVEPSWSIRWSGGSSIPGRRNIRA
jgi:hypothetical protein